MTGVYCLLLNQMLLHYFVSDDRCLSSDKLTPFIYNFGESANRLAKIKESNM